MLFRLDTKCRLNWIVCSVVFQITVLKVIVFLFYFILLSISLPCYGSFPTFCTTCSQSVNPSPQ